MIEGQSTEIKQVTNKKNPARQKAVYKLSELNRKNKDDLLKNKEDFLKNKT